MVSADINHIFVVLRSLFSDRHVDIMFYDRSYSAMSGKRPKKVTPPPGVWPVVTPPGGVGGATPSACSGVGLIDETSELEQHFPCEKGNIFG